MNIVGNSLEIYDTEIAKGSWCTVKIDDVMDGKYYLRRIGQDWQLIKRGYRVIEKDWEVFAGGELGLDSGTLLFESGDNQMDVIIRERVEKVIGKKTKLVRSNEIISLEVCRDDTGMIFGIRIFS